jgi:hypothetical protein
LLEGKRLYAEAITVSASTLFDLYALQKNPYLFLVKHPRLKIRGLRSPIPPADFQLLAQPFQHPLLTALTSLDAVGCGQRDRISYDDMAAMGYGTVITDIELWSGPQEFTQTYGYELSAKLRGIADYGLNVSFRDAPSSLQLALQQLERLRVASIVLQTKDQGYNPIRLAFCAEQSAMEVAAYRRHHVNTLRQYFDQHALKIDQDMLQSYEEGLHRGAFMRLKVQPPDGFSINDLKFYRPEDYREVLGISLRVNHRTAAQSDTPAAVAVTPDVPTLEPVVAEHSSTTANPVLDEPLVNAVLQNQRLPAELQWPDLQQALQRDILVVTESGGKHRGRLETVQPHLLVLKKRMGAGSFTYAIERRRFQHAQLLN